MEVIAMANFCKHCGTVLNVGARFCKGCGKAVGAQAAPAQPAQPQAAQPQQAKQPAPPVQPIYQTRQMPGYATQPAPGQKAAVADPARGPIIFSWQSLKNAFKAIAALVKKPSALIPMLIIIALQTALSFIKISAPWNRLVTVFSFLTFAQGGMYGGGIGAIGGIIGRGIFAWAIGSLVIALWGRGKKQPKAPAQKAGTHGAAPRIILGAGLGLVLYNFLTGDASIENALIGVTCAIACFRTAKRGRGYLTGLISSFTGGRLRQGEVSHIVLGLALGMAAGTLSSLALSGYWCYVAGAVLFVAGLIFTLLGKNAPRAAAVCFVLGLALWPTAFVVTPVQAAPAASEPVDSSTPAKM